MYIYIYIYILALLPNAIHMHGVNLRATPEVKYKRGHISQTKRMFDLQAIALVNLRALQFTSEDCKFEDYSRALVNLRARVLWVGKDD